MKDLNGKIALVTGGAGGIGTATARHLIEAGARVVIADLDVARARSVAEGFGNSAIPVQLDVTSELSWIEARDSVERVWGPCDILISNAGVAYAGTLDTISPDAWRWVYEVNVVGSLHAVRTFLPGMKQRNQKAHITLVSSVTALHALPEHGAYTSSKAALLNFASVLKRELDNTQIGVSVLCPGVVNTEISANAVRARPQSLKVSHSSAPPVSAKIGMAADFVGRAVVDGIRNDSFYVFTHADYAASIATDRDQMLAAMSESADPAYREPDALLRPALASSNQ